LSVLPTILVSEALGNLKILVDASRADKKLFWLLRRLWKSKETGFVAVGERASGNKEFSSAFGRRSQQHRSLDLCEVCVAVSTEINGDG
jgi:hypothetical protein